MHSSVHKKYQQQTILNIVLPIKEKSFFWWEMQPAYELIFFFKLTVKVGTIFIEKKSFQLSQELEDLT